MDGINRLSDKSVTHSPLQLKLLSRQSGMAATEDLTGATVA